jgi:hypothetical protein
MGRLAIQDRVVDVRVPAPRGRAGSRAGHDRARASAAAARGFEGLRKETADWWRDFWARGMVYLHSESGQADFVEANYT